MCVIVYVCFHADWDTVQPLAMVSVCVCIDGKRIDQINS